MRKKNASERGRGGHGKKRKGARRDDRRRDRRRFRSARGLDLCSDLDAACGWAIGPEDRGPDTVIDVEHRQP